MIALGVHGSITRLIVGFTALALAASGCGGDEGTNGGEAQEIKIGLPHPLTGAWAEGGQNSVNGAMLAIEDVNAAGGIEALDGAQLVGVSADTSSEDPGQAASVTRRLALQDGVSAYIGSYVSAFTLTASTEAEREGIPMLTQSFVDELTERGYANMFQLPPTSSEISGSSVEYVSAAFEAAGAELGRVAVISSNDAALQAQAKGTAQSAEKAGFDVVSTEFYPVDVSDASALVQSVISEDPELIFLGGPTTAAILVVQTLRSLDYDGPVVGLGGGGILNKGFAEALGDGVNGVLSLAAWNWDMPYEGVVDVDAAYRERYDEPFMPQEAGESYAAVWVIKEAIEQAGSSEAGDIAEALRSIELTSGPGSFMPGGKVQFDETGLNDSAYPILIQWQDGTPKTVWPEDVQAVDPTS